MRASAARARNAADWEPLRVYSADLMPLYHQLKQQIREQAMRLDLNTMIPSEKELMDLAGVGRATVRRAISDWSRKVSSRRIKAVAPSPLGRVLRRPYRARRALRRR